MSDYSACPDDRFGPWAGLYCRGGFDFTLLFEETILSILVSSVFLCLSAVALALSFKQPNKVESHVVGWAKLALSASFIALRAANLGLYETQDNYNGTDSETTKTRATIPSAALALVASVVYAVLSAVKHRASLRPSLLITAYLSITMLLDVARVRTLWLKDGVTSATRGVVTASLALNVVMLLVENTEKKSYLVDIYSETSKESVSGPINRSLFWWLNALFVRGYNNVLDFQDLYTLDDELKSARLSALLSEEWKNVPDKEKPNALFGAWFSAFQIPILLPAFPRLFMIGFTFAQPFLVTAAIQLAALPQQDPYNNLGYGLIGAYVLVYGGIAISTGQFEWRSWRSATMMRGSVIPLIHEKALVLDSSTHTGLSHMGALTLISTDIETIVQGVTQLHETWSNLIEIGLSIYLLERQLGPACVMSVGFAIVVLVGTGFVAVPTGARQAAWNQASQDRVSATSNTLGNVKWIKISGLTDVAFSAIRNLRTRELNISERFRWLLGVSIVLSLSTPILGPLLTFATAAGVALHSNSDLTISNIFTAFSIMVLLNSPLTKIIIALPQIAGATTSFQRIQDFLNAKEWSDQRHIPTDGNSSAEVSTEKSASKAEEANREGTAALISGRFFWTVKEPDTPEDDTKEGSTDGVVVEKNDPIPSIVVSTPLEIPRNKLTVVMGPVGCGKSTFLRVLLGELSFEGDLSLHFSGAIAFCEQNPWLPNETVRQTITGRLSTNDDETEAETTSKLLGDENWYHTVIHACQLQKDIDLWPKGDETMLGSKGITMSGGQKQRLSLARAVYARRELLLLDDPFSGIDASTGDAMFTSLLGPKGLLRSSNMTVVLTSSSSRVVPYADKLVTLDAEGQVTSSAYLNKPSEVAKVKEALVDSAITSDEHAAKVNPSDPARARDAPPQEDLITVTEAQADAARQVGDSAVYKYYASAAGYPTLIGFVIAIAVFAFCDAFPSIWLKWWAEDNEKNPNSNLGKWFGVYTVLCIGALAACFTGMWQLFIVAINKSGKQFHEILLHTVSLAPMSFHATTDVGTVINRFSQDLQLIDMELPPAALGVTMSLSFGLAQFILVCVSSKYMSIFIPFLFLAFYAIGHFYLRTARQLRHLDIELKAPLYSHAMHTLSGIVSIRAFKWEDRTTQKNMHILDRSQRPSYLLYCAQRWLTFAVNMVIMLLAIVLIVVVTTLREAIGSGYVGVALSNILAFSFTVQAIITSWVQLEVSLGAVARIKTFAGALPSEDQLIKERNGLSADDELVKPTDKGPGSAWPARGQVSIEKLVASYSSTAPVLKGISLVVEASQKVAICGRTGSGKSSLFLSILGLIDQDSGSIVVDDVDLASVPREYLRSNIVAIPQEAYVLDGSVRKNVDAHHQHGKNLTEAEFGERDELVTSALKKVGLWDLIEARGGLDTLMDDIFLSQGQMQLLMLARAMMRQTGSRLLLIDEATSSLDDITSASINEVINTNFSEWTVLSIVHKLETTLAYDKVLVLDKGQVLEYGSPRALLEQDSAYKRLYQMSTDNQL